MCDYLWLYIFMLWLLIARHALKAYLEYERDSSTTSALAKGATAKRPSVYRSSASYDSVHSGAGKAMAMK